MKLKDLVAHAAEHENRAFPGKSLVQHSAKPLINLECAAPVARIDHEVEANGEHLRSPAKSVSHRNRRVRADQFPIEKHQTVDRPSEATPPELARKEIHRTRLAEHHFKQARQRRDLRGLQFIGGFDLKLQSHSLYVASGSENSG